MVKSSCSNALVCTSIQSYITSLFPSSSHALSRPARLNDHDMRYVTYRVISKDRGVG